MQETCHEKIIINDLNDWGTSAVKQLSVFWLYALWFHVVKGQGQLYVDSLHCGSSFPSQPILKT